MMALMKRTLVAKLNMCFQGSQCSTTGSNGGNQVTVSFQGTVCDNTGNTKICLDPDHIITIP